MLSLAAWCKVQEWQAEISDLDQHTQDLLGVLCSSKFVPGRCS